MNIKEILLKVAKGEALTDEEKKFLEAYEEPKIEDKSSELEALQLKAENEEKARKLQEEEAKTAKAEMERIKKEHEEAMARIAEDGKNKELLSKIENEKAKKRKLEEEERARVALEEEKERIRKEEKAKQDAMEAELNKYRQANILSEFRLDLKADSEKKPWLSKQIVKIEEMLKSHPIDECKKMYEAMLILVDDEEEEKRYNARKKAGTLGTADKNTIEKKELEVGKKDKYDGLRDKVLEKYNIKRRV